MVEETNAKAKATQELNKEKLKLKRDNCLKLEAELEELIALDRYDTDIALLSSKLFWCDYYMQDEIVNKVEVSVSDSLNKLKILKDKLTDLNEKLNQLGTVEDVEKTTVSIQLELESVISEINICQKKVVEASKLIGSYENAIRQINSNRSELTSRLQSAKAEVV